MSQVRWLDLRSGDPSQAQKAFRSAVQARKDLCRRFTQASQAPSLSKGRPFSLPRLYPTWPATGPAPPGSSAPGPGFGSPAQPLSRLDPAGPTAPSGFGQAAVTTSAFGAAAPSTGGFAAAFGNMRQGGPAPQQQPFGQPQSSVFGQGATPFGAQAPTAFGAPAPAAPTAFGAPAAPTAFGQPAAFAAPQQPGASAPNPFGQAAQQTFGMPAGPGQMPAGGFGTPPPSAQPSPVFGQAAAQPLFQAQAPTPGPQPLFGAAAPQAPGLNASQPTPGAAAAPVQVLGGLAPPSAPNGQGQGAPADEEAAWRAPAFTLGQIPETSPPAMYCQ